VGPLGWLAQKKKDSQLRKIRYAAATFFRSALYATTERIAPHDDDTQRMEDFFF
jgi:hypothetical protein